MPTSNDLSAAIAALSDPKLTFARAETAAPRRPGLYAVHASGATWERLGLGTPKDDRPLYVGKSESSLLTRDINTHFGDGSTGQSTVRRSFAALLREPLSLSGIPRNPAKPGYFANYGLSPDDDAKLTAWMRKHLSLGLWAPGRAVVLRRIEVEVIAHWAPPLNLTDVVTEWTPMLKAARKLMADDARRWSAKPAGSN
jgi:hypothetical protein